MSVPSPDSILMTNRNDILVSDQGTLQCDDRRGRTHAEQGLSWTTDTSEGNRGVEEKVDESDTGRMIYRIYDTPPIFTWIIYGLQQSFTCASSGTTVPFVLVTYICAENLPEVRAEILSLSFLMAGIATLLQNTIGIRLPLVQGPSLGYMPAVIAMMRLEQWKCPASNLDLENGEEPWKVRLREINGNLLAASLLHCLLGATGVIGLCLRFIGPLTVGPTIMLLGVTLAYVTIDFASNHWGVAFFTAGLMLVFSMWLGKLRVPLPHYKRGTGCVIVRFRIFVVISVILAMVCGWLLCLVLTEAGVLPTNSTEPAFKARTDPYLYVVESTPWIRFPYPFYLGLPTVSVAGVVGMFLAALASILESLGDYFTAARVMQTPPPPPNAINRGIAIEGFGSILSAMMGAGHATTTYSNCIASVAITKVASRRVFQTAGVIMIVCGLFTKLGAIIALIPEPVIGGSNIILLGSLISLGMAIVFSADMGSPRNVAVLGAVLLLGMGIPYWLNPDPSKVSTGVQILDEILHVLLGTPMFLGGVLGAILDNIVPGSPEERGILNLQRKAPTTSSSDGSEQSEEDVQKEVALTYDLPYVSDFLQKRACCAYVPFLPPFKGCTLRKNPKREKTEGPRIDARVDQAHYNDAFTGVRL